jgi:hypothetical protein
MRYYILNYLKHEVSEFKLDTKKQNLKRINVAANQSKGCLDKVVYYLKKKNPSELSKTE